MPVKQPGNPTRDDEVDFPLTIPDYSRDHVRGASLFDRGQTVLFQSFQKFQSSKRFERLEQLERFELNYTMLTPRTYALWRMLLIA